MADQHAHHAADSHSLHNSLLVPEGTGMQPAPPAPPVRTDTSCSDPKLSTITAEEQADAFEQAEEGIEANDFTSDDDLGYESDSASSTSASLASSARNFIYENGRRYHSFREGSYSFPNDDREQDREDLKHAMYLKLFNGTLHFAPLDGESKLNAIDLGTGTGIWAIDCEDPCARVASVIASLIACQLPICIRMLTCWESI